MTEVLCLLARPYDPTRTIALAGPPVPAGVAAAGAELDFTYNGGEVELPLSDAGFTSAASDTPPATHFPPRLLSPFNFRAALFEGDEPAGRSKPGFGDIRIENSDGVLDGYMAQGWDGRDIALWRGEKLAAFSTFTKVFAGTSAGIEWSDSELIVRLRDGQQVFEKPIQSLVYGGAGGMDGGADIAGKYRPQAYGRVFNAPAVAVDPVTLLYQVHDRALLAIDAVRDKGVALSAGVDHGDSADLLAASIAAGDFDTCLAEGAFRLGASPAGTITCDLRGDAEGGYVETTGGIVRRIVTTRLGGESFSDPAEIDTAAFAQIEVDQPAAVGFWVGPEPMPTGDVLDRLMTGAGGYWQTGLDGQISLAVLKAPGAPGALAWLYEFDVQQSLDTPGGAPAIAFTRPSLANAQNADGSLTPVGSGIPRVTDLGLELEPAATNRILWPITIDNFIFRGACAAVADDIAAPDGTATADSISGIGAQAVDDFFILASGFTASARVENAFWIKRISTTGTLGVYNSAHATLGSWTIDLALLSSGWERITRDHAAVTILIEFTADGSGQAGLNFYRNAGASALSFYIWGVGQEERTFATSDVTWGAGAVATRDQDSASFSVPDLSASGFTLFIHTEISRVDDYSTLVSVGLGGDPRLGTAASDRINFYDAYTSFDGPTGTIVGDHKFAVSVSASGVIHIARDGVVTSATGAVFTNIGATWYLALMQRTLESYAGSVVFRRLGMTSRPLSVAELTRLTSGAPAGTIGAGEILATPAIRRRGLLPTWVQRVAWKTAWQVQSPDDLAAGVSASDRALYGAPARYARAQVSTVRTKHRQAREVETASLFALEADAVAEAARRATLYGERRDIYRVAVTRSAWDFAMGQEVAIAGFARFGFADPEYFIVVGIEIDVKTARTVLDLWK